MKVEEFDFYGVSVRISSEDESALTLLLEDFSYFQKKLSGPANIQIHLNSKDSLLRKKPSFPLFQTRMCHVRKVCGGRYFDYGGETRAEMFWRGRTRVFHVSSPIQEELYEVAYVILLSAAGESLDNRGWHRVHALGLAFQNQGVLVVLPQGGGKSALATLLSDRSDIRFFSDEIPLVKGGKLHPFPLRKALRPEVARALGLSLEGGRAFRRKVFPEKWLFPFLDQEVASSLPVHTVLIGSRSSAESAPRICSSSRWRVFWGLFETMVIGRGVPQMAEYMLRFNPRLIAIFFSRLKEALRISSRARSYTFEVSPDARANAEALLRFLDAE